MSTIAGTIRTRYWTAEPALRLQGKWRIVEAELWDRTYLDLVEPAFITLDDQGNGEMAYGVLTAALDCAYMQSGFDFTWNGVDEGDQVSGDGWAELQADGSLLGEISYQNGDKTTFKALPWRILQQPARLFNP